MIPYEDKPEYTIPPDGHHPAADDALKWLQLYIIDQPYKYSRIVEAIYSTALSGNKTSNYCVGTLERLAKSQPVSDRYLLGLVWTVQQLSLQSDEHLQQHIEGK